MADAGVAPTGFEALCLRHGQLLDAQAEDHLDAEAAAAFVADAAAAGVQIESVGDRDAIRSMINYWTATIARLPIEAEAAAPASTGSAAPPPASAPAASPVVRPMLASFDAAQSPVLDDQANPFVGLAAFDAPDSAKFFGRDKVVADLLQHVLAAPLVVVSGASGTGKSSLVRAGLVAAIRHDPADADWLIAVVSPGRDPVASLASALAPQTVVPGAGEIDWIEQFRQQVDTDPASAGPIVAARMAAAGLLLIIDQMEELFSLCQPEDRDRAAQAIAAIADLPGAHVVVTIRDEYLENERAARVLPALDLAAAPEFRVPPLQIDDIRAAIVAPAAQVGLVFQDGVVDRIVADVGTDPAALPLLQYALLRLWKRRDGNRITMATYDEVGGPSTALSNAAQEIYDGLGSTQAKENCRIIFQQLVRPSLLYEFVRDRVTRGELERLLPPDSIRTILTPFVAAALIRVTPGSDRGADRIEIVHEALIRNWDMLRRWSFEVRDQERAYLSLDAQAQRWMASGRAFGHLLFGRALREAEAIREDYRQRARVDPVSDRRVDLFLKRARSIQQRVWSGLTVAAFTALVLIAGIVFLKYRNGSIALQVTTAESVLTKRQMQLQSLQRTTADLSEAAASLTAQADASSIDDDAGRQFIQMLVSRGSIPSGELPTAFAGMTETAVIWPRSGRAPRYAADFLNTGAAIDPRVIATGLVRLDLDNMRVFFDPASGVPRLIVSQLDRSRAASAGPANALYRWPRLDGQPDEVALARAGVVLAHLVDRREVAWGPQAASATQGANLIATMQPLYPTGARGAPLAAWPATLAWMRLGHDPQAGRVVYYTGAVAGDGSVGTTIPRLLWKIAVSRGADGRLVADAAMLPAPSPATSSDLPGRTTIAAIAAATRIDFRALQAALAADVPASGGGGGATAPAAVAAAAPMAPARVYIEVRDVGPDQAAAIRASLAGEGFIVPRVEQVDPCIEIPELRYYFRQDAEAAARASSIAGAAIGAAGLGGVTVTIKRLDPGRYKSARPGTLELWVCGTGATAKD